MNPLLNWRRFFPLLLLLLLLPLPLLAASPPPASASVELDRLAERIHDLVNLERAKHALPPLGWDVALARIAWQHSCDMAARHYLGHTSPEGASPTARGEKDGYFCRRDEGGSLVVGLGENLFQNHLDRAVLRVTIDGRIHERHESKTFEEIAASTVYGWLDSKGHRGNLLHQDYISTGIGIALADDGSIYITQLFC